MVLLERLASAQVQQCRNGTADGSVWEHNAAYLRIKGELDLVAWRRRDGVRIKDKPVFPYVDTDYGPEGCCGE